MNNEINTVNKTAEFKKEVSDKVFTYIGAAFGFVAGLAWNDAIKSLIDVLFPLGTGTVFAKFVYAILVTALLVFVSIFLIKKFNKK